MSASATVRLTNVFLMVFWKTLKLCGQRKLDKYNKALDTQIKLVTAIGSLLLLVFLWEKNEHPNLFFRIILVHFTVTYTSRVRDASIAAVLRSVKF